MSATSQGQLISVKLGLTPDLGNLAYTAVDHLYDHLPKRERGGLRLPDSASPALEVFQSLRWIAQCTLESGTAAGLRALTLHGQLIADAVAGVMTECTEVLVDVDQGVITTYRLVVAGEAMQALGRMLRGQRASLVIFAPEQFEGTYGPRNAGRNYVRLFRDLPKIHGL